MPRRRGVWGQVLWHHAWHSTVTAYARLSSSTVKHLVVIALAIASLQCSRRADPEIHLIPLGYRGKVRILFRSRNGVPARVENGARVYAIPANGLLLTQDAPNEGLGPAFRFFFVTPAGERTPIYRIHTSSRVPSTEVGIAFLGLGRFQAGLAAPCDIPTYEYFVGTGKDLEVTDESKESERMWPIIRDNYVCP